MKKIIFALITISFISSISFADSPPPETETTAAPEAQTAQPAAPTTESEPAQAQPAATDSHVKGEAILKTEDPGNLVGTLVSFLPANYSRANSKISVNDEKGQPQDFIVKPLAVVYNTAGEIISLSKVAMGANVEVSYRTTKEGQKEATAVKISK